MIKMKNGKLPHLSKTFMENLLPVSSIPRSKKESMKRTYKLRSQFFFLIT